jgi:hypothetical protein
MVLNLVCVVLVKAQNFVINVSIAERSMYSAVTVLVQDIQIIHDALFARVVVKYKKYVLVVMVWEDGNAVDVVVPVKKLVHCVVVQVLKSGKNLVEIVHKPDK